MRPRKRTDLPGRAHAGRGLCRRCYSTGDRAEFPPLGRGGVRTGRPAEHVLQDAEWLADLDRGDLANAGLIGLPIAARRDVAARLQIPLATLDRAIYRARHRRAGQLDLARRRLTLAEHGR